MSQNWGSGQTNTGSSTSTTNKYFNPAAILGLTNYYGNQLGQQGSLNNSILYGSSAAPGTAPATTAPATTTPATTAPATTTPSSGVLGGTPQRHVAPGTTTPATTTPTTTGTTPGSGSSHPLQPTTAPTEPALVSHGETPVASTVSQPVTDAAPATGMKITPGPGDSTAPGPPPTPATTTTTPATTTTDASSNAGLLSALQGLLNNGGYSATEQQAITEKAAEALAAQKGSSQAQMADQLARSGNAAGYGGAMSSLDNSAAQTASDQARQNQIDFANEQERQKELGASGLTSLLGINTAAQLGTSGQAAGLASLGGGVDTSSQGSSDFSNQNYQATPDPSANPGTKVTPGGGTTGTPGTDKNGLKPGDPNYDPTTDPGNPKYQPGDANGLHPGQPGYDPTSDPKAPGYDPQLDPHSTDYHTDANGNTYNSPNYDPRTDPTQPQYDPTLDPNDPSYEPPGGVLPDPTGGDPTDPGITGGTDPGTDPGDGGGSDVRFAPPKAYFSSYGAPAPPPPNSTGSPDYISALKRMLAM